MCEEIERKLLKTYFAFLLSFGTSVQTLFDT